MEHLISRARSSKVLNYDDLKRKYVRGRDIIQNFDNYKKEKELTSEMIKEAINEENILMMGNKSRNKNSGKKAKKKSEKVSETKEVMKQLKEIRGDPSLNLKQTTT